MKHDRKVSPVGITLMAVATLVCLLVFLASQGSLKSPTTQFFEVATLVSARVGFQKAANYFDKRYGESQARDIVEAADQGRLARKVDFVRAGSDYHHVIRLLAHSWAPTSGVQILHATVSAEKLTIYVRTSDERAVSNYLWSLKSEEIERPFE